jgi:hypothetical protein
MGSSQVNMFPALVLSLLVISSARVRGQTQAGYLPSMESGIAVLEQVANNAALPAWVRERAALTAQTASGLAKDKALMYSKDLKQQDGAAQRKPKDVYREGHETPPEKLEMVFISEPKLRARYGRMIANGRSEAEAKRSCEWLLAMILIHEVVHVNQSNEGQPNQTEAEREAEAYGVEIDVETYLVDFNVAGDQAVTEELEKMRQEAMVMGTPYGWM